MGDSKPPTGNGNTALVRARHTGVEGGREHEGEHWADWHLAWRSPVGSLSHMWLHFQYKITHIL